MVKVLTMAKIFTILYSEYFKYIGEKEDNLVFS